MVNTVPPWLESIRADLGQEEIPGPAVNPRIIARARLPGVKFPTVPGLVNYGLGYKSDDGQAWCGAEAGGSLAEVGIMPPFNAANDEGSYFWAASFRTWGVPCDMRVGAIACYDGHVNMVDEIIDADTFWGIGGNQLSPNGGAVTRSRRKRSDVITFRWPDDAALVQAGLQQFSLSAKPGDAATTTVRPLIKLNSTGGFVTELQKVLGISATGIFDAATDAAVRAFQRQHGLGDDGEVGPKTWGALLGAPITIAGDIPHAAEYLADWQRMAILPEHAAELDEIARKLIGHKARYLGAVAATNVPWWFVAAIHERESSANFDRNIHNGQPLGQVTTDAPAGRGPFASFEDSVHDWIVLKGLDKIAAWPIERFAYQSEANNGMGYRNRGVPSAYLWSFTNIYLGGKYVADGVWGAKAMDGQSGTMPLLKRMMDLDASIVPATAAPKPIDGEVLDPLKPGETQPPAAPLNGALIIGAGLLFLFRLMEQKPMANDPAQVGQGPDLSKLLADVQKIGVLLQNPVLQKVLGGKPVTLQEMLSLLPTLAPMLQGSPLALPPPVAVPDKPVLVDVPSTPPVTTTPPAADSNPGIVKGSVWALAASILGMVTGTVGTPFGMGADPTTTGTLATVIPLITAGLGAVGGFSPIINVGLKVLGAVIPALANSLPKK